MAMRSEHLPIYKQAYDLCLYLEQVVQGFSRYHRYAIGLDLRNTSRGVCSENGAPPHNRPSP